ncbi:MAG: class I SAM-dependent methyltransferase, partial [Pseudomonadota bacterium]
ETQAARCVGAIPEGIGASRLDGARGQVMCLTPEHRLPFHDQQFTRIVLLHALEEADHPRSLLREAWRVLAPEGRIVVAVANRKSFWSVTEAQAFGHGRPWTRRQLIAFLNDSLFQVTASTTAVHMPPINWRLITAAANAWERVGERVLPALGGVVLVEATKRLYAHPGGSAPATVTNARPASTKPVSLPRKEAA